MTKKFSIENLNQHLQNTNQTFALAMTLGGLTEGIGNDHSQSCPHCGGADRFWYSADCGRFFCRNCMPKGGYSIYDLVMHHRSIDFKEARNLIVRESGFIPARAAPEKPESKKQRFEEGTVRKAAEYIYTDEDGKQQHKIVRYEGIETATGEPGKTFSQFKRENGEWVKGKPTLTFPYRLLEVLLAVTLFIVEGEKTADCLRQVLWAAGVETAVATTSPMGAQNGHLWKEYGQRYPSIADTRNIILADNDEAGTKYARTVAVAMREVNPEANVRIVVLPDLPEGGDFVDWYAEMKKNGKDESDAIEALKALCKNAEQVTAEEIAKWKQSEPAKTASTLTTGKPHKGKIVEIRPDLVLVSEVDEKPITWLWENKIPCAMLILISGLGGIGKSFWTIYLTAVITNGWNWADGKPCEKGSVLFFYGEEGIEDTYKTRFRANGADDSKIVFLKGVVQFDENDECSDADVTLAMVDVIEEAIRSTEEKTGLPVKMVVIDPISNYWGGVQENSNADVRSVLKPLQMLAERTGTAFVMIQHTGKGDKEHAQQKVLGSTGIVAACRAVWGVYIAPECSDNRLFAPVKVNCGFGHTAVSFRIAPPDGTVEIINPSIANLTGDDIEAARQAAKKSAPGRPKKELTEAKELLQNLLTDGERPAKEILKIAEEKGISESTLRAAKDELGIVAARRGGSQGYSVWKFSTSIDSENHSNAPIDKND